MFLMICSTGQCLTIDGVECRLWRGADEQGRPYDLFVHRIGSDDPYAQELLAKELQTRLPPEKIA